MTAPIRHNDVSSGQFEADCDAQVLMPIFIQCAGTPVLLTCYSGYLMNVITFRVKYQF